MIKIAWDYCQTHAASQLGWLYLRLCAQPVWFFMTCWGTTTMTWQWLQRYYSVIYFTYDGLSICAALPTHHSVDATRPQPPKPCVPLLPALFTGVSQGWTTTWKCMWSITHSASAWSVCGVPSAIWNNHGQFYLWTINVFIIYDIYIISVSILILFIQFGRLWKFLPSCI